jgi:hypothetical protein
MAQLSLSTLQGASCKTVESWFKSMDTARIAIQRGYVTSFSMEEGLYMKCVRTPEDCARMEVEYADKYAAHERRFGSLYGDRPAATEAVYQLF